MSSGVFTRSIYEADNGDFHPIRVQDTTISLAFGSTTNAAGDGPIDNPVSAKVSNGNRAFGVKPRSVTITFESAPPSGYKSNAYIRVPILTPDVYNAINTGDTCTYLGSTGTVAGKNPERVR